MNVMSVVASWPTCDAPQASDSIVLLLSLCKARVIETPLNVQLPVETEPTLFAISPN